MKNRLLLAATLGAASSAFAAPALINGDFESAPFDTGWTTGGTVTGGASIVGSGTTAAILSATASLTQDFESGITDGVGLTNFQFDFAFRYNGAVGNSRIRLRDNNNSGDLITLSLTATGISRYSGSFTQVLTQTLSADTTYFVRLAVANLDSAARNYTIGLSTDGTNYTTSALLTSFHLPVDGSDFETIRFESGTGNTLTLDNVAFTDFAAIPEPSTYGLLGAGALAAVAFVRRRRRACIRKPGA